MDIGTISLILLISLLVLLAIGMPLGFASGILAVAVLVMRFGFDSVFGDFGRGVGNILVQRMYGLTTDYVIISVPLFIFMATCTPALANGLVAHAVVLHLLRL